MPDIEIDLKLTRREANALISVITTAATQRYQQGDYKLRDVETCVLVQNRIVGAMTNRKVTADER